MSEQQYVSLKQMAESKVEGVGKATIFMLSPELVEVERGFNARPINKEHLLSLVEAIKEGAVLPPVVVRMKEGRVVLVDGHHRRDAVIYGMQHGFLSPDQRIACIQYRGDDIECRTLMLTAAQGLPLTPLQAGVQYEILAKEGGLTTAQIAAKIGKSVQHVADLRKLAGADEDVKALVESGKVSASVATKAVRKDRAGAGERLRAEVTRAEQMGKAKATPKTMGRDPAATSGGAISSPADAVASGGDRSLGEFSVRLTKHGSIVQVYLCMDQKNGLGISEVPIIQDNHELIDHVITPTGLREKIEWLKAAAGYGESEVQNVGKG